MRPRPDTRPRRATWAVLAAGLVTVATVVTGLSRTDAADAGVPGDRPVMFVGNNWDGTATVVDARTHRRVKTLNIVPDRAQELQDLYTHPDRLAFYLAVQQGVGEGHDQYVDDMFTTRDGRLLAVSRPSFADVVWIDLATGRIVGEQQMDGYRTDHMGVSPDGRRLLVSDSTARSVHEYVMGGRGDPRTGTRLRSFASGDTPHENNYFDGGRRILHASIGRVYTPLDYPRVGPVPLGTVHDAVKADRWFQVVRTSDFAVLRRWDMGEELAEAGYPDMSSAVRPVALSPDGRTAYLQVSFLHGFVEFRLDRRDPTGGGDYTVGDKSEPATGVVTRVAQLPVSEEVRDMPREQYVLDSAHHGIAMGPGGNRLCVAGTMSDYAAIVDRRTFDYRLFQGHGRFLRSRVYAKPYWATTSRTDGNCWVSMSGSDLVSVIDYDTRRVVAEVPVGDHPQRVRDGLVDPAVLRAWSAGWATSKPDLSPVPISAPQRAAADAWAEQRRQQILAGLGG
ncbi:MAG: serine/threonine protein kinase [Nocardioidaceae bacterium]|nr:serine/threonine protein kinase [Nocardioidaceae bacterium]NUS50753.1 serine/threonine protein kinase [Nocardioidaceae bacterium]